jgi:cytochrome P450
VSNARICSKEIEIAGVTLKPGDKVLLPTPLAARDPEEYDEPNAIRFDRGGQNITFGYGIHRCLGIHLAQREIQTALEQMLSSLPEFRIEPGARIPFRTGSILQLNELPIVWG